MFVKMQMAAVIKNLLMSILFVHPSTWNISPFTGYTFMKFYFRSLAKICQKKVKFGLDGAKQWAL
jgi:uncharacterized membrane protein